MIELFKEKRLAYKNPETHKSPSMPESPGQSPGQSPDIPENTEKIQAEQRKQIEEALKSKAQEAQEAQETPKSKPKENSNQSLGKKINGKIENFQKSIYEGVGLQKDGTPQIYTNTPEDSEKMKEIKKTASKVFMDGIILNIGRSATEIVAPALSTVRSLTRMITQPLIGTFKSIRHPIQAIKNLPENTLKYLANPVRAVSSTLRLASNLIKTPFSLLNTAYQNIIVEGYQFFDKNVLSHILLIDWISNKLVLNAIKGIGLVPYGADYLTSGLSLGTTKLDNIVKDFQLK